MKHDDERPDEQFRRLVVQMASSRTEAVAARPAASPLRQMLHKVVAALRFDSASVAPAASGLRGAWGGAMATADVRHLLFSAKGRDIDLRVSPGDGGCSLSGQVLGPDEGGRVELAGHLRAGSPPPPPTRHAGIDLLGEFHVDDIVPGTYVLTLFVGRDPIVLPPIDIHAGD